MYYFQTLLLESKMRQLTILLITIFCLLQSSISHAEPAKTHAFVDASEFIGTKASCWYDNKRYSEGSLIQIHSFTLVCGIKEPNNPNSQLIWLKLDKQGNTIYPDTPKKITVH